MLFDQICNKGSRDGVLRERNGDNSVPEGRYTPGAEYTYSVKWNPNALIRQPAATKPTATYTFGTSNNGQVDFASFDTVTVQSKK